MPRCWPGRVSKIATSYSGGASTWPAMVQVEWACSSCGRSGFIAASLIDGGFECYRLIATVSTWASVTGLSLQEPERVELRFERAMCLLEIKGLQRHVRISIACRCHSDVEFVAFPLVKS